MESKLPGITFDKAPTFKKHTQNLCRTGNHKLNVLRRIRKYLSLGKAKALGIAFVDSQVNYSSIILLICKKTVYLEMHKIHQKSLKVIYQPDTSYEDLLELSNSVSIH